MNQVGRSACDVVGILGEIATQFSNGREKLKTVSTEGSLSGLHLNAWRIERRLFLILLVNALLMSQSKSFIGLRLTFQIEFEALF